jgi:hypothetical protein
MIYLDCIDENIRVTLEGMLSQIMQLVRLKGLNDDFRDDDLDEFLVQYEKIRKKYDEKL